MKKNHLLLFVLLCFGISCIAQPTLPKNQKEEVIGSQYMFDEWADGIVYFEDEKDEKYEKIKIDLMNNQLEILSQGSEKVLRYNEFNKIKLNHPDNHPDAYFQSAIKLKYKGKRLNGFARVTPIGDDFKVVKNFIVRVIPPSMNAKIVGAEHKKKIKKETRIYVSKDGELHRIKKKKDLFKLLPHKGKNLKTYVHKNNLNYKKEIDLIKIIEHYQE